MAIEGIASARIGGTLVLAGTTTAPTRPGSREERTQRTSGQAMKVEISPEAKRRSASVQVSANNAEAAESATWFASADGREALAGAARRR